MKLGSIIKSLSGPMRRVGLKIRKNSPKILMIGSTVGTIAGVAMACNATIKADRIISEAKEDLKKVNEVAEKPEDYVKDGEEYTEEDKKNDRIIICAKAGAKIVKAYIPAIVTLGASLYCGNKSYRILSERNLCLSAAYAGLNKTFKKYRQDIIDRLGKEEERKIRYGIKEKDITETIVDEEGKEKTINKKVEYVDCDPNQYSEYARFFDESSAYWEKSPEYNLFFLKTKQNYFNDKLRVDHVVFLNDVYEALDIPKTKAGQIVGWHYDLKNPSGDNYIDFGIFEINRPRARDFVNGYERNILLDFNVDGEVLQYL